jgi:hypothetical protein
VLLLGAFAALTYWLTRRSRSAIASSTDRTVTIRRLHRELPRCQPDAQGRAPVADRQGGATLPRRRHDRPAGPQITSATPTSRISRYRPTAPPSPATASTRITGNVKGVRDAADAKSGAVTLTSEFLHVIPKQDRVLTDKAVTIEDARGTINATGMEFDNRSKKLKFGSRVHGEMLPQK